MVTGRSEAQVRTRVRADVIDLEKVRVRRLAQVLTPALESGHAIVDTSEVESGKRWRQAARLAARDRGWKIRTGVSADGCRVWAVRLDRETTEADRVVLRHQLDYLSGLLRTR